ncbi:ABC transporter substrate-binding protein [Paracidovorax konjaci]|uniref:ABC-type branched-chain amino acid transport system, substrate-binding protein n=1 Tax=Paracidovorax konjaci TaxID=32040 RepID=A0A1I1UWI2_9BURK|nr:ABC transporter substrate-binding protein [Paracidovorax konjaci]SFD75116.1 ABC-type branched-chain amino acid transport system, substrate-binding protein [Paracidovorax konjaci]
MHRRVFTQGLAASLTLPWALRAAQAAGPVTVGMVVPLTGGTAAEVGKQVALGVETYFAEVHRGDVRLMLEDDEFKPEKTVAGARKLLAAKPAALISFATSNTQALIEARIPQESGVPLFPTRSGSQVIREPVNPFVFHVRAGYSTEIVKIVAQMAGAIGITKFAALYQDDAYGKTGLAALQAALEQRKLKLVASAPYDRTTSDIQPALGTLRGVDAQVIVMVAGHKAASAFVQAYGSAGGHAQLVGISDLDPAKLVQEVGAERARGVSLTQVFPSLSSQSIPVVREFHQLMVAAKKPESVSSLATFEGFLVAKAIGQGLKAAGGGSAAVDGRALADVLNRTPRWDLGGFDLSFQNGRREGSLFTEIAIIDSSGRARY